MILDNSNNTYFDRYEIIVVYRMEGDNEVDHFLTLEKSTTLKGHPFVVNKLGTLIYRGLELRISDPQRVTEDNSLSVWLQAVTPKLKLAKKSKQKCMNCKFWDRQAGIKHLTEVTHEYKNASFCRLDEIQRAISSHVGGSPLTTSNIGFCPKNNGCLKASTGTTCKHYVSRGHIAVIRNWWRSMVV